MPSDVTIRAQEQVRIERDVAVADLATTRRALEVLYAFSETMLLTFGIDPTTIPDILQAQAALNAAIPSERMTCRIHQEESLSPYIWLVRLWNDEDVQHAYDANSRTFVAACGYQPTPAPMVEPLEVEAHYPRCAACIEQGAPT